MKTAWVVIGKVLAYATWPLVWLVIRFSTRSKLLIICGDEVLLLKGWLSTGQWCLPGGGLHRNEDPSVGAIRETHEETKIVVRKTQVQRLGKFRQTKGQTHLFYGFSLELPKKPTMTLRWTEIADAAWVPLADITKYRTEQHVQLLVNAWQKQR